MPPPAPDLMEDLVEDILLRFPPEDPGCLFRAAIICKRWRGLLTGRAFARRYCQFHRAPPLLGFFENHLFGCEFTAFSSPASPVPPIHPGHRRLDALDSRHGLVLLVVNDSQTLLLDRLAVWDPLCRRQWEFPFPFPQLAGPLGFGHRMYSAAVLCAADGCDHLNCRAGDGHFLVAFLWIEGEGGFHASLYSSEFRAWSPVTSVEHPVAENLYYKPKVLVGNALYFTCQCEPTVMILRYDLASQELSIMGGPAGSQANYNQYVLVGTGADNGVLGFANVQGSKLCVWSMEASANGRTVAWGQQRVVELEKLLPPHAFSAELYLTGFTEGVGVIVLTNAGTFAIELKSGRVKDVPGRNPYSFPYSSFYTPDQGGVILPRAALEVGPNVMLQQPNMDVNEEREDDDDDDYEESEWKDDDDDEESGEDFADDLEQANLMFDMWSKAIVDGDFGLAVMCATSTLECRFSCHGKLSPKCAYTYYIYGCTLLYSPQPDIEPYLERDGVEDIMSLPDFHPAWKLLHIARTILERCPGSSMEKVKVFSALADVKILSTLGRESMRLEDKDYSLGVCLKALAISERLIEPDNYWIIKLNVSICLIFEFVSNIGDAVAYCAKAISLCQSRISNLKNASASAAEAGPERSPLDYEMEFLTGLACKLEKKLEHLKQAKPTPTTKASGERNVGFAIPRAASLTPFSNLLELLSVLDPVLHKTSCTPIWSELQDA